MRPVRMACNLHHLMIMLELLCHRCPLVVDSVHLDLKLLDAVFQLGHAMPLLFVASLNVLSARLQSESRTSLAGLTMVWLCNVLMEGFLISLVEAPIGTACSG